MCSNFLERISKQWSLNRLNIAEDRENERNESSYAIIHCKLKDITKVETPDGTSNSSDPALLLIVPNKSLQVDTCIQCDCNPIGPGEDASCGDSDSKFNVIAARLDRSTDRYSLSDDEDERSDIEWTLAIVKPGAFRYKNAIRRRIIHEGFDICAERIVQLTLEQAAEFYSKEYGKLSFPLLAVHLSSGPIQALVLTRSRAVNQWRRLIGPKDVKEAKLYFPNSIRGTYGEIGDDIQNVVHGSLTIEDARNEILFFFPNFIVEPILPQEYIPDYFKRTLSHFLIEGLAQLQKDKPGEPLLWLANWLVENHPEKPKSL